MVVRRTYLACLVGLSSCSLSSDALGGTVDESTADDATANTDADRDAGRNDGDARARLDAAQDASVPDEAAPPVMTTPDAALPSCPLAGSYALRVDADVTWGPDLSLNDMEAWTPAVALGAGKTTLFARADVKAGVLVLRPCGLRFPAITTVAGVNIGGSIPDATWDVVTTTWTTNGVTQCDHPGCAITTNALQAQLGIQLPPGVAWPPLLADPTKLQVSDVDGDGVPGIRFMLDSPFSLFAPTGMSWVTPVIKVTSLMMALGLDGHLTGQLDSCTGASGQVVDFELRSRVLGCSLDTGDACIASQTQVLQDNLPSWKAGTSTWKMTSVPTDSSCGDVRAALP